MIYWNPWLEENGMHSVHKTPCSLKKVGFPISRLEAKRLELSDVLRRVLIQFRGMFWYNEKGELELAPYSFRKDYISDEVV
ncbi:hypothetical protein TNCV_4804681 [Trichonephila clavipes]|nr:hypothetical protein TNCV_4804681 [Trichonephila clavipes]